MKITVQGKFLRLHEGTLGLSKDQAGRRLHNLKKRDDGRYDIINPVEFKIGEDFEYEGNGLPKDYMGKPEAPVKPKDVAGSSTGESEADDLMKMKASYLQAMAKGLEIEGYTSMNRAELVEAIEAAQAEAEDEDEDEGLSAMKMDDLKPMAEELGIEGYKSMNKPTLIEAIEAAQAEPEDDEPEEDEDDA